VQSRSEGIAPQPEPHSAGSQASNVPESPPYEAGFLMQEPVVPSTSGRGACPPWAFPPRENLGPFVVNRTGTNGSPFHITELMLAAGEDALRKVSLLFPARLTKREARALAASVYTSMQHARCNATMEGLVQDHKVAKATLVGPAERLFTCQMPGCGNARKATGLSPGSPAIAPTATSRI